MVGINSLEDSDLNSTLASRLHVSIIVPIGSLFFLLVGILLTFHITLLLKNETTHEFLKNVYDFTGTGNDKKTGMTQATVNPYIQ